MPYATQDQIQFAAGGPARFLSLTDWDGDNVADAVVVAQAQAGADGWIDEFLRARYSTPIANPTETLVRIAAEEAVYYIRRVRGMLGPEDITSRTERAREMEQMRLGKLRPDDPLPAKSTATRSVFVENESDVNRETLKGFA